jgi:hypothetical protein
MVAPAVGAQRTSARIFELRTYTAAEGKLQVLSNRFRDRTIALFKKHGMTVVGFWIPNDPPEATNQLVYLMAWPSRAVADKTWAEFGADPEWKALVEQTEKDGRLWTKLDRVWLAPTEFSLLK